MTSLFNNITRKAVKMLSICALLCTSVAVTSCSDEDPFFSATEDDAPRILNTNIPEWKDGKAATIKTLSRADNFEFKVIATPIHYTTVEWFLDGQKIFEGADIDMAIPAGNHELKIVATNTKHTDLSTYRITRLVVNPLPEDPAFGQKLNELWAKPGEVTTITGCANTDKIKKVLVGETEAQFEVVDGSTVELMAPAALAEGYYPITLVDAEGKEYGGGALNVTSEPRPVYEEVLWEGSFDVTWGTPFDKLKDESKTLVESGKLKVGTTLRVYVDGNGQGAATSAWWNNILTGEGDPNRGDVMINGSMKLEYVLNETSISLINNQDGLLVVGDGYKVLKVTVEN